MYEGQSILEVTCQVLLTLLFATGSLPGGFHDLVKVWQPGILSLCPTHPQHLDEKHTPLLLTAHGAVI